MIHHQTHSRPWWLAVCVSGVGAVCLWDASRLDLTSRYAGIGPGLLVMVVGAALVLLGAILAWQIHSGVEFEPEQAEDTDATVGTRKLSLLLATIAVALPVAAIESLGFAIVAALSFALIAGALGSTTHVKNLAGGLVLSTFTWWAFTALGVQLGPYLPLMAG